MLKAVRGVPRGNGLSLRVGDEHCEVSSARLSGQCLCAKAASRRPWAERLPTEALEPIALESSGSFRQGNELRCCPSMLEAVRGVPRGNGLSMRIGDEHCEVSSARLSGQCLCAKAASRRPWAERLPTEALEPIALESGGIIKLWN